LNKAHTLFNVLNYLSLQLLIPAEAPQATASEGLAQGAFVAAREGFEPDQRRRITQ